jgi:hypothetical protein
MLVGMAILQHLYSMRQRYPNKASQWEKEKAVFWRVATFQTSRLRKSLFCHQVETFAWLQPRPHEV